MSLYQSRGQEKQSNWSELLKKFFLYCLTTVILFTSSAFAYLNGIPTTALQPGALYVDYTVPGIGSLQSLSSATNNVTTLKILGVAVSANRVGVGQTVTISYDLVNTSTSNTVTGINPQLNFMQTTTGNVQNSYFNVTRISPATSYSLAGGATQTNVFRVTVLATRPTGNFIVDGLVSGLSTNDQYWSSALINGGYVFTGSSTPNVIRELTATLNIASINVISPSGAIDRTVSTGQGFTVSFNVVNLGEASVIGVRTVRIQLNGGNTDLAYTPGTVINQLLTAPAIAGTYIVTATIVGVGAPIDESTGAAPAIQNGSVTLSLTVQNPAALDILAIAVPTSQVAPGQTGPVLIDVGVLNTGGATAQLTLTAADLGFTTSGNNTTAEFSITGPASPVNLAGGAQTTLSYTVNVFGTTLGSCTVNVTLNGQDANSGVALVATPATTEMANFYIRFSAPTLNINGLQIISPNGAIDTVLSGGQDFWVSCNVQNLGQTAPGGTLQAQIQWPASIVNAPAITTKTFTIGQPITFNLTASANSFGSGVVTVSIVSTVPIHPIDPVTGLTVNYLNQATTLAITVQAPALLDIISMTIPTTQVQAFQTNSPPVTVDVLVRNIGSANARITVANSDLQFMLFPGTTVLGVPPSASMLITANQTVTVRYLINQFGSGPGICTVNVTINALDLNSSFNIVTASVAAPEFATYNVTFDAKVFLGAVSINPSVVSANGSFQVYVPITGATAAGSVSVEPATTDLLITAIPGGNNLTCNVTSVIPASFTLTGTQTVMMTYNVTILPAAVSGQYTVNIKNSAPAATDNISGLSVSPPSGAPATATLNYDPLAPSLIAATPNLDVIPTLTRPTDNFRVTLRYSETMNVSALPVLGFALSGAAPTAGALHGTWTVDTFQSSPMTLVSANEGFVTLSYLSGATDIAGNAALASPNFLRFYVDATKPTATISINNGQLITVNTIISITANLTDNYPLTNTNNMWMMLVTPGSDVSTNPGITVNQWLPYSQAITLDVDTLGGYTTKNIAMYFRDEAGNVSELTTASIFLDTAFIALVSPSAGVIISTNVVLTANTSAYVPSVSFWVSVNNTQTRLAVINNQGSGQFSYAWTTANVFCPTATTNVEFYALRHGAIAATSNSMTGISIDNVAPQVTVNAPGPLAYVAGTITISATATDNGQLVTVNSLMLVISWPTGSAIVTTAATDAVTATYTLPAVADMTTFSIAALAYDAVGNLAWSTTVNVIKYDATPLLNILVPTPGIFVRQNFTISGNASSLLSINMVTVTTVNTVLAVTQSTGVGQVNWQATINSLVASGLPLDITVNAYTDTVPALVSAVTTSYVVDETTPNIVINITNGMSAVGTLNITGSVTDALSGVSAVAISVDAGTWVAVSPAAFSYPLAITQPTHSFTIAVSDNAWPIPNTYSITYIITRNFNLLPTGNFVNPVSGSYVNNTMSITVTASTWDSQPALAVWVLFTDNAGLGYSQLLTANSVGGITWNVQWPVPQSNNPLWHGVTYSAAVRVQTAQMIADVSPAPQAVYVQDVYGAEAVFTDANEGKKVYYGGYLHFMNYMTGTLGALVSTSYLVVDGSVAKQGVLTSAVTNNTTWIVSFNPDLYPGSVHVINLRTIDRVGNIVDSPTIAIRTIPSTVVTERLPADGKINGANILYNPIYSTNQAEVVFKNISTMNISAVKIDNTSIPVSWNGSGELLVDIGAGPGGLTESVKVIALIEGEPLTGIVTPHYQPVYYDITPPTVNVVFDGVHRYYPGGYIAPNEIFRINVQDSKVVTESAAGIMYPSITVIGLSQSASVNYIVTPSGEVTASLVLRSLYAVGTTASVALTGDSYDPYTGIFSFRPASNLASRDYILEMFVVDNAGNTLNVTYNVGSLVVENGATGESGGIDKDLFYSAYPNPYDPDEGEMQITYYLKDNAKKTKIYIYNEIGELLKVITIDNSGEEGTRAGYNAVSWDGKDNFRKKIANGIYLFMVVVDGDDGQSHVKGKFIVLRR